MKSNLHIWPTLFPQIAGNVVAVPFTVNVSFKQFPKDGPIIWKSVNSKYSSVAYE